MELSVLYGFTIFLLTISLMKHVRAAAIDIPLVSKLNAPLKAELDISILTTELKELIANEVKQAVSEAMKDLAQNIVDNKTQSAVENLQTSNNLTISTLLKEIEEVAARKEGDVRTMKDKHRLYKNDVTARKNDVRIMEENLENSIEQQKITESKLSSVEAQLKSSTKREQKYHTLEQNHEYLNQEHSTLLKKYSVLENVIFAITNKTIHAEEKDIYQERFNNEIDMRIQMQVEKLNTIRNKSLQVEKGVLSLKQLVSTKPLNAIHVIQQTVNTLASQTNILRVHEQALSQDFLALFNMTFDTKKTLAELCKNVNSQIQELGYNQTVSLVAIEHNMTSELNDFQINQNKAFPNFETMIIILLW